MKANKNRYTIVTCAQIEILKNAYNMINKDQGHHPYYVVLKIILNNIWIVMMNLQTNWTTIEIEMGFDLGSFHGIKCLHDVLLCDSFIFHIKFFFAVT
jgi:hypothetical protein